LHTERGRLSANAEATKAYLEGVHCYRRDTREGIALGFQHFNRAVALDPNFVMAYNGLFETYIGGFRMWPTQAAMNAGLRASAGKLMELDATLAEAHAARAWIDYLDWKWADSEKGFQRALLLNPDCAIAHMRYGFTLVYLGRPDEGHRHLLRAELLDPTLPRIKKNLGHVFYAKRQFERAIE
jgi:tetratricopeptide (TPR) repeat protein